MPRYKCAVCDKQRTIRTSVRPSCCSRKMNRLDNERKRNIIRMKSTGVAGQGGSAPSPHRCKVCGGYHSQHGIKAGKTSGLCHKCVARPPKEDWCTETTALGEQCKRLGVKDGKCRYHYKLSQSASSNSKSSSVSESSEAPNSSI